MTKIILSGGCSFTYGNELSDCNGTHGPPSNKTWAKGLSDLHGANYFSVAQGGIGNSAIARKVFTYVSNNVCDAVLVMWTFPSRYDWAMPRSSFLEDTRWASITPWDTDEKQGEVFRTLNGSEPQQEMWRKRREELATTGVKEFANSLYKYAANEYHEIYLSWKSIIWLQNFLEKYHIPFMFTLADNSLFYNHYTPHSHRDALMQSLYKEIDITKWFSFGERMMGFNQWALLEGYERGTTHPLDSAHKDAVKLMKDKFNSIINENRRNYDIKLD
jgi:hypothetical protein